jgi:hypothetical protein
MFDIDAFVASCREALAEDQSRLAVSETLTQALRGSAEVSAVLGRSSGGLEVLFNTADLTVLNVVWAPHMSLYPHDHRMWAVIGIYGGAEDNTLFQRAPEGIIRSGGRELRERDVFSLDADAIHSVDNPTGRFTGAIHVYGGDFLKQARSQWDPDNLVEQPYDIEQGLRVFAEANAAWAAEVGQDLDDEVL